MSAFAVLLAAHAIGDYVFQTAASIAEKREKRLRSWRFWRHIAGHGLLAALALALAEVPPGRALLIGALSAAVHGVVDWAKVAVDPRLPERSPWKVRAYLLDQILHVLTAYVLAATTPAAPDPALLVASSWIALMLLSTAGIGHAIGMYLARFGEVPGEEGLPGAGRQIHFPVRRHPTRPIPRPNGVRADRHPRQCGGRGVAGPAVSIRPSARQLVSTKKGQPMGAGL